MNQFDEFEARLHLSRPPRRPLSADFTQATLHKATTSKFAHIKRHLTRTSLIIAGSLAAGGLTVAVAATNPGGLTTTIADATKLLGQAVTAKTDPATGHTILTDQSNLCAGLNLTYEAAPGTDPAEATTYVQANCDTMRLISQFRSLFPAAIVSSPGNTQHGKTFMQPGWWTSTGAYHLVNGQPTVTIQGHTLPLPAGTAIVTGDGTALNQAGLHDGDGLMVLMQTSTRPTIDDWKDPSLTHVLSLSTVKALGKYSLPTQYYDPTGNPRPVHVLTPNLPGEKG
jgi:hypothetical protein